MSEPEPVRVLIVDGDRRVRRALRALLEAEPALLVVGEAATGAEALACARATQPGVILLDLLLPTIEEGLCLLPRLAGWPVVALCVRGGLRDAALRAGASTFLEKGAAPELLLRAIRVAAGPGAGVG